MAALEDPRTDDELLAATAREPEAFGVLYERHAQKVLRCLANWSGDVELALDLTAETFAAALVQAKRYRPGEAPAEAWLLGIARNKLADSRRRRGREESARRKLGVARLEFTDEDIERVERELGHANGALAEGLTELPEAEREAITARVIEERDYAAIAAADGASQAAIRKRVSRGLSKLARIKEKRT